MTTEAKPKTPVLIAVPMRRFDPENAGSDLPKHVQELLAVLTASPELPWTFEVMVFGGGNVSRGRNKIVAQFLRGHWKWISFLDDDIQANDGDPKTLARALVAILSRKAHVCGSLYTTKSGDNPKWVLNTYREAEIDARGLLQVPELGTGGFKTYHRTVFERLIALEPELAYVCDETRAPEWGFFCQGLMTVDGRRRWLPEDYWMDQLCRKHGIPVWVDTTVKLRHLDTGTGLTYPLDDDWPRLPGPTKPAVPPPLAEDVEGNDATGRLVIALQYWEGDRLAAQRLVTFIADLEPAFRHDVEVCLVRRHDAYAMDAAVVERLAAKFSVRHLIIAEHTVGYPQSPNAMAFGVMEAAASWEGVDAVMLMEADCVPIARDWVDQLKAEWNRAASQGKLVLGSWRAECAPEGHINGNLCFSPALVEKAGVKPCPPKKPWDVWFVRYFEPHWMRTGLISNRYCCMFLTDEQIITPECGTKPPAVVHGCKDRSVWKYVEKIGLLK